jgi:hypothetical protein
MVMRSQELERAPLPSLRGVRVCAVLALGAAGFALAFSVVPVASPEPESPRAPAPSAAVATRRVWSDGALRRAEYAFVSFNGDALTLAAALPEADVAAAIAEYGYRTDAPRELQAWYEREWEGVSRRHRQRWDEATARWNALEQAAVVRVNEADRVAVARYNEAARRGQSAYVLDGELAEARQEARARLAADRAERDRVAEELRAASTRTRDADYQAVEAERARRRERIYADAGFRLQGNRLEVDMRSVVRKNAPRLTPVAAELHRLARGRGYALDGAIDALVAMVQTALEYRVPPEEEAGRRTSGLHPPPQSFSEGWGDCDTKSALIAAVLASFEAVRLVGVTIPRPPHYLLAVQRVPRGGDTYLEYEGLPYVMLEAAGPGAFRPGTVGPDTLRYLQSGEAPAVEAL